MVPNWAHTKAWQIRSANQGVTLERLAEATLDGYFEAKSRSGPRNPVPIYDLARWLGAELEPRSDYNRSASLDSQPHMRKPLLRVRQSDAAAHRRFSVAHEVGHLMLHSPGLHDRNMEDLRRKAKESEANRFAAELLMPRREVMYVAQNWSVDPAQVCGFFKVSEAAMAYRLKNLRLIP